MVFSLMVFGLGGWVVAIWVLYNGWCWLYKGSLASITRKGLLYTALLLVVLAQLVLWNVDNGDELGTTTLANNGGVLGGFLGVFFKKFIREYWWHFSDIHSWPCLCIGDYKIISP